jgi:hypothetical protein
MYLILYGNKRLCHKNGLEIYDNDNTPLTCKLCGKNAWTLEGNVFVCEHGDEYWLDDQDDLWLIAGLIRVLDSVPMDKVNFYISEDDPWK